MSQGRACEDEEGGAVGDEAGAVQGDAIGDGAHGVLAHAKAQVALLGRVLLEVAKLLHQRHVGGRQVSGAAPEPCMRYAVHQEDNHHGEYKPSRAPC